jgi:hypothetical protein
LYKKLGQKNHAFFFAYEQKLYALHPTFLALFIFGTFLPSHQFYLLCLSASKYSQASFLGQKAKKSCYGYGPNGTKSVPHQVIYSIHQKQKISLIAGEQ